MKYRLLSALLCLALASCVQAERVRPKPEQVIFDKPLINPTNPPDGKRLVQILLENHSFPLKGTGCASSPDDNRTLLHLLASTFGSGLNNNSLDKNGQLRKLLSVDIWGGCKTERFELRSGPDIEAWRCTLYAEDRVDDKDAYTFSSSINFGVRKDSWKLITDSITPNPLICIP